MDHKVRRDQKAIRATPEMLVHKDQRETLDPQVHKVRKARQVRKVQREIQAQPAQLVQPVQRVLQTRFQSAL